MAKKIFLFYGIAICALFLYASFYGWTIADSVASGKFTPQGHNVYHK